jgi:hypothetical protein
MTAEEFGMEEFDYAAVEQFHDERLERLVVLESE